MKRSLLFAIVLHAGAALWIARMRVPHAEETNEPLVEIAIDETIVHEEIGSSSGEGDGVAPLRARATRGTGSIARGDSQGEATSVGEGLVVVAEGDGIPLGGDIHGFALPSGESVKTQEQKSPAPTNLSERTRTMLRDALYDRDKELGMGAEGPVLQALETATYGSALTGTAIFDITIGPDGIVASIDTNSAEWKNVAESAKLAAKKARVPASAKGVAIRIQITSQVLLPSGHSPTAKVDALGIPLTKGGDDKSPRVSILNPVPKIVQVPVDREGKMNVPVPIVQFEILNTNVDPTDLTPRPRQVVNAKVLDEHLF